MAASTYFVNNQTLIRCYSHQLWLTNRPNRRSLHDWRATNRINHLSLSFSNSGARTQFQESPLKAYCTQNMSQELETITSEEQFDTILEASKQSSIPVLVDWMAAWCRKCIYLKPKLKKLATELHQHVKFYCVDVNTVPQSLVKRAGVNKMPTIQLWKDGEKCDEVIGGHQAWLVVGEVREMLQKHVLDSTIE